MLCVIIILLIGIYTVNLLEVNFNYVTNKLKLKKKTVQLESSSKTNKVNSRGNRIVPRVDPGPGQRYYLFNTLEG